MTRRVAALVCGFVLVVAGKASAQLIAWEDRAFVNLTGAGQTGNTKDLTTNFKSFSVYGETAAASGKQTVSTGGGLFDVTVGARAWNNLGIGLSFWSGS